MKNLIVLCHPNPKSFTNAICKTLEDALKAKGESFVTRNLYELKFNPVLDGADFMSFRAGNIPADIAAEQKLIAQAQNIIFVYPLWWTGLPAMLKGYVDRVFSRGFAWDFADGQLKKMLTGKRGMLITCHGNPKDFYDSIGMYNALNLTSDNGIFDFCGIDVVAHQYFDSVPSSTEEQRKQMLVQVEKLAAKLV
ncbi:MAG: flavodoxin family protein [Proteobacteria bacterium]|nr:flavodoxin family protein [Pseudomonadota bacterium]